MSCASAGLKMKAKDKSANLTPDILKRPRGRPSKGDAALTGAQRVAKLRAERKAAGCCPCCGQLLPPGQPKN